MINVELLHFLRPWLLLMVPLVFLSWWLVRRHETQKVLTASFVAPHLQDALTVNRRTTFRLRPVDGAAVAMLATAIAAAGPTWSKLPSPWFSETAPLVIAIEVSDSMRSNDLQPTRLDRARFKIIDLITARTGSRTALIAYGGSAHIVMPPSKDLEVIKPFLESLDPAIMPEAGANAAAVLPLAQEMLGSEAAIGTLLFVNDGFAQEDIPALQTHADQTGAASVMALVVGSDAGGVALLPDGSAALGADGSRLDTSIDARLLDRVEGRADLPIVRATTGSGDIRALLRRIESNLQLADDPNAQWQDQAWWFVWPAALLTLLWFRRGWTMQW
ncbi:MAG: vWA domain-containing protein [Pseudomonadales bacterium]